jgi:hypothetical protein
MATSDIAVTFLDRNLRELLHQPYDRPDPGEVSSPDAGDSPATSRCAAVVLFDAIQGGKIAVIELELGRSHVLLEVLWLVVAGSSRPR